MAQTKQRKTTRLRASLEHKARKKQERTSGHQRVTGGRKRKERRPGRPRKREVRRDVDIRLAPERVQDPGAITAAALQVAANWTSAR